MIVGVSLLSLLSGRFSGSGAVIPAGTTVAVFTSSEGTLLDIDKDEMQEMVDEWYLNKVINSFMSYSPGGSTSTSLAMSRLGYLVGKSNVSARMIDQYNYEIIVDLDNDEFAIFIFQPFQEAHLWKFNTLEGVNDLAKAIIRQMRR